MDEDCCGEEGGGGDGSPQHAGHPVPGQPQQVGGEGPGPLDPGYSAYITVDISTHIYLYHEVHHREYHSSCCFARVKVCTLKKILKDLPRKQLLNIRHCKRADETSFKYLSELHMI